MAQNSLPRGAATGCRALYVGPLFIEKGRLWGQAKFSGGVMVPYVGRQRWLTREVLEELHGGYTAYIGLGCD